MGKEKPVPVYVVKRNRVSCCGSGAILAIVLSIIMMAQCDGQSSRSSRSSTRAHSTPSTTPSVAVPDPLRPIIGLNRAEVVGKFPNAQRSLAYEANVDPNAVKLITDEILIVVYFDNNDIAEGVSFLSQSPYLGNPVDGSGSYVHQNYQMLLQAAAGGAQVPVRTNVSTTYPVDVHIGNIHE